MHEMPKPSKEHERFKQMVGTWVGEETIHPSMWDPKGGTARGKMVGRLALGGFHFIADYEQERNGVKNFEGHGVFGWDPRGRCYTLHWFDSMGIEHGAPAFGTWDNNALVLQHEMTQFGYSRQVYEVGNGEYRLLLQNSRNGNEWTTFLEGHYRRVD